MSRPRPAPKRPAPGRARQARPEDVAAIAALVDKYARRGEVLPRSAESIEETIADWWVAEDGEGMLACGALWVYGESLAEVRTLLVDGRAQRQGWGQVILEALLAEARRRGVSTMLTLTRTGPFFARAGFGVTRRHAYPEKIAKDCLGCALHEHCDKTAMSLALSQEAGLSQQAAPEEPAERVRKQVGSRERP